MASPTSFAEPLRDKRRRHRTRWQWPKPVLMALHHRQERHNKRNCHQEPEHERVGMVADYR